MIKKSDNCLYCGEKMESITAKKKYCSSLCRVYYNREKNSQLENGIPDKSDTEVPSISPQELKTIPLGPNKDMPGVGVTLEKIKESCPKELTGLDRTIWIKEQRKINGV